MVKMRWRCAGRAGLTLLELVLALGLSVIIFMTIGYFGAWQAELTESRHQLIQETQIARVVLSQIANHLRNVAVPISEPSGASEASSASASSNGTSSNSSGSSTSGSSTGGGATAAGGTSGASGTTGSSGSTTGSTSSGGSGGSTSTGSTSQSPDDEIVSSVPGIYGTRNQMLVDARYVPTVADQMLLSQNVTQATAGPLLADIRSVMYLVDTPQYADGGTGADNGLDNSLRHQPHLLWYALPRASLEWQSMNGGSSQVWLNAQTLSTAVRVFECWYYDGSEWLDTWDTEASGSLPVAVQLLIWVDANEGSTLVPPLQLRDAVATGSADSVIASHIYSTIVTFPVQYISSGSSASSSTTSSTSSSQSSSTSGTPSSSGSSSNASNSAGSSTSGSGGSRSGGSTSGGSNTGGSNGSNSSPGAGGSPSGGRGGVQ